MQRKSSRLLKTESLVNPSLPVSGTGISIRMHIALRDGIRTGTTATFLLVALKTVTKIVFALFTALLISISSPRIARAGSEDHGDLDSEVSDRYKLYFTCVSHS